MAVEKSPLVAKVGIRRWPAKVPKAEEHQAMTWSSVGTVAVVVRAAVWQSGRMPGHVLLSGATTHLT
jgi:hypothetical protein